ncbi:Stp1/IreP family PP2C-type Ser/Thr phosphatase [Acetohalobium arabaticum]|uniref:protein-serine/threonine phosphatase n=1 Tax=Acetohalobium arabaticum (strain ATCC 49924 / DSM 5501 / Z-7288) TaxID=574087 RepID=D9QR04_ACEAZ|nr:Stp1/IreP family PP2C-type Ser/Thr phosphatase [Acetohalobium arabaticum]ADL12945.1 protein serine/threonine phosphatase [Acetohalobium arabaticum DSM 5501]
MESGFKSDCGKIREQNEDNYLQTEQNGLKIFAVADGMGGHNAGEVASSIAIEMLRDHNFSFNRVPGDLIEVIEAINNQIKNKAEQNPEYQGMGTTLTAAVLSENQVYIGHVGDSRAYLLRNREFKQLTEDHSLVNRLVKDGKITAEEAKDHPQSNVLLQALGTESQVDIDLIELEAKTGDLFLLCSDGLNTMLSDREVKSILLEEKSLQQKADKLVQRAKEFGGYDNITINLFAVS